MNIILIGPPGTGKGTMAKMIEEEFGYKHISAGDLLRDEVKKQSPLGKKAEPIMKAGKLVDDRLVAEIISSNVPKYAKSGFVLDGFPRNMKQARILEEIFKKTKTRIDAVLLIETDDHAIVERLSSRRQCPKCHTIYGLNIPPKTDGRCDNDGAKLVLRDDDKPEVITKRLEVYHQSAGELVEFYSKKMLVKKINGNTVPEKVFLQIKKAILGGEK